MEENIFIYLPLTCDIRLDAAPKSSLCWMGLYFSKIDLSIRKTSPNRSWAATHSVSFLSEKEKI